MTSVMLQHLMSYVGLLKFIKDSYKAGEKHTTPPLLLQHIKQGELRLLWKQRNFCL